MSAFAGVLAMAAFVAWAPELQAFGACAEAVVEGSPGTVESVRQVTLPRDLHAFEPLAHSLRPQTASEVVVRLDAGPLMVFTQADTRQISAGRRVRVQLNGSGARMEPDSSECATPLAFGNSAPAAIRS